MSAQSFGQVLNKVLFSFISRRKKRFQNLSTSPRGLFPSGILFSLICSHEGLIFPLLQALKAAFTALMTCDAAKVASSIEALVARLSKESQSRSLGRKEQLVLKLNEQYPKDVGVLSAYFLNLIELKRGEAIYLAANMPHAYLSGELVEAMATSDSVIRAGLTPKFRDTAVLCSSLTYEQGAAACRALSWWCIAGDILHEYVHCRSALHRRSTLLLDVQMSSNEH